MVLSREPSIKGITKRHRSRLSLKVIDRQRVGVGENPRHPRAWAQIDLGALSHNVTQLKNFLSPTTELMAVVKADAYGHGAVEVARTVLEAGASRLAIATAEEGIRLRKAGITAPILVLGAINHPEEIPDLCRWDLQPTLCTRTQAEVFQRTLDELNTKLSVHLKLDTGMSRLGTLWDRAAEFVKYVYDQSCFEVVSIYSHLATADNPEILDGQSDLSVIQMQHRRFEDAIAQIKAMGIVPPPVPSGQFGGDIIRSILTLRSRQGGTRSVRTLSRTASSLEARPQTRPTS